MKHRVQPRAEGHCIYPLFLTPRIKLQTPLMIPRTTVVRGNFFALFKKFVPLFKIFVFQTALNLGKMHFQNLFFQKRVHFFYFSLKT